MTWMIVLAGGLLGVLSRIEETTGLSAGVSTNATWVAAAFAAGVAHRRASGRRAAATGALALTAANLAYYATVALREPGVDLTQVAGPPAVWLALGLTGGAVFALVGRVWATAGGATRVLASLPLAGVCIAQGIAAVDGGPPAEVVGLALGAALPVASATGGRERALGVVLSTGVVAVALTGRLGALLP